MATPVVDQDHPIWGWERFFNELSSFLQSAENAEHPNRDYCEYVVHRMEMWIVSVAQLVTHLESMNGNSVAIRFIGPLAEFIDYLRVVLNVWHGHLNEHDVRSPYSYAVETSQNQQNPGRPRFTITKDQIEYLRSMSFTWVQISELLGVSYMTIYRRKIEYGIDLDNRGRDVSDADLLRIVNEMRREQPALGQTMVWGRLRSLGVHVTRARVRATLRTTDPINNAFRWREMTPRRPYSVAGPNSLWHLDGQHKLIRWRMVVHAAIDGYSRTVVFIRCSDNNRASTVYDLFLKAVGHYGLPSRIRADQGGENTLLAQHMLRHRGVSRSSVLIGSSVHNQRRQSQMCNGFVLPLVLLP